MLLLVNYAQYLKKNILQSLFQKIKLGRILSNSFSEDSVISLWRPDKDVIKKENNRLDQYLSWTDAKSPLKC